MDIFKAKKVYFVGIKGVAQTSLALCLADLGIEVLGSDVGEEFVTEKVLRERRFKIFTDFNPEHIEANIDLVVFTGAHFGSQNVEVKRAQELGIPVMSHAMALGELTKGKDLIAVCGAGGKSTTTAMIAWILSKVGASPSFAVGVGNVSGLGVPGKFTRDSSWFVSEADEYAVDPQVDKRPRFTFLNPKIIVCTNLKYDHPDVYASFEDTKRTFLEFFNRLPDDGTLILNGDDEALMSLRESLTTKANVITVGTSSVCDFVLSQFALNDRISSCTVTSKSGENYVLKLPVPGKFNLMNAQMAVIAAKLAGTSIDAAVSAVAEFGGTMRRFEAKGVVGGSVWYDDYAHTPEEIKATLGALKQWEKGKRIVAVFQPHTYSRTRSLFNEFSRSFTDANEVVLLDIFASAREAADAGISSNMLMQEILKTEENKSVKNVKTINGAAEYLKTILEPNVVVITIGAGDVYKVFDVLKGDL